MTSANMTGAIVNGAEMKDPQNEPRQNDHHVLGSNL